MARLRFDLVETRAAMVVQHALLDDVVAALPPEAFPRPTRLAGWTGAELTAYLGLDIAAVSRDLGGAPAVRAEIDAADYVLRAAAGAADVDERVRLMTADARPAELREQVHSARLSCEHAVAGATASFVVPSRLGAIALPQFL